MIEAVMSMMQENAALWVFAYGSLLWKPGFHYHRKVVGHIKGFKRRFFQGNTNLRGSVSQPGRVAILVPDEQEMTWGVAYEIRGQQHVQHALEHLYVRENTNGGYHTMLNTFHPRRSPADSDDDSDPESDVSDSDVSDSDVSDDPDGDVSEDLSEPFSVLSFTATPSCPLYMGPAEVGTMARQVVAARGEAGTNAEYVLRTAEFVREHIPEDEDEHLFGLESSIRELLAAGAGVREQQKLRRTSLHHDTLSPPPPILRAVSVPV